MRTACGAGYAGGMSLLCPVCSAATGHDSPLCCRICHTPHHRACWHYIGHCSTYGCSSLDADPPAAFPLVPAGGGAGAQLAANGARFAPTAVLHRREGLLYYSRQGVELELRPEDV